MTVKALLAEVESWGATIVVAEDRLVVDVPEEFPEALIQRLTHQKREVMASVRHSSIDWLKKRYKRIYPGEGTGTGEMDEIEHLVREEGVCLVWATALEDFVAFYRSEADRDKIPPGFTAYSDAELVHLFGPGQPEISTSTLRLIHAAKKAGACITGVEPDTAQGD